MGKISRLRIHGRTSAPWREQGLTEEEMAQLAPDRPPEAPRRTEKNTPASAQKRRPRP